MARERKTTKKIGDAIKKHDRFYANVKGSSYGSTNGMFDIITIDKNGYFLGIEAKSTSGRPSPTQLRRCREAIENKGRAIIAYPHDFDLDAIDNYKIPQYNYQHEDMKLPKHTLEIVIKGGEDYGE